MLTVKGTDLNGRPEGNTGTGTFRVNIKDVNDNPPTLEKDEVSRTLLHQPDPRSVCALENTPNSILQPDPRSV